ncbi:MAG: flippase-like domain-containing protein [Candidatus Altiarchaeota archaeon]
MRLRFILLFLLGVLIILGVFFYSGPEAVVRDLLKFNFKYFVLLFFIQVFLMVFWALKWRVVLKHYNVSFRNVLLVSFAGYFANNLTPVNMAGGEPVMAYLLPKVDKNISTESSAASVIVNTFLTIFPVFGLILLAIILGFSYNLPLKLALVLFVGGSVVAFVFFAVLFLFVKQEYSRRIITFAIRFLKKFPLVFISEHALNAEKRIDAIIDNFNDAMNKTMTDKTIMLSGIAISTIIWLGYILQTYLIFNFIGFPVPLQTILVVKIVAIMIGFLSITPGGVGIWEGVSAWLFSLYNIPLSTATAAVFIERLFTFWIGSFIGFLAVVYLGGSYILEKYI